MYMENRTVGFAHILAGWAQILASMRSRLMFVKQRVYTQS